METAPLSGDDRGCQAVCAGDSTSSFPRDGSRQGAVRAEHSSGIRPEQRAVRRRELRGPTKRCWRASCSDTLKAPSRCAPQGQAGALRAGARGTIFLDEVSEIPFSLQGRLLRVLQEREVIRLGHDRVIPVDVRILCATNRDLRRLVDEGDFLGISTAAELLPLSSAASRAARRHLAADASLPRYALPGGAHGIVFSDDALSFLVQSAWSGNVRELRNLCERLFVVCPGIRGCGIPVPPHGIRRADPAHAAGSRSSADVEWALAEARGSVRRAAEILGIHGRPSGGGASVGRAGSA